MKPLRYRLHQPLIIAEKRHTKRWASVLLGLVVGAIAVVKILTGPAEGHRVAVDQVIKKSTKSVTLAPASTLDNQYFGLHLPIGYKLNTTQTAAADSLYAATIFKPSTDGTNIINVGIHQLGEGGLSDFSNYRLRSVAPTTYRESSQIIGGDTVTTFVRIDGENGEVVAFWPHGGRLATLAISTGLQAVSGDSDANTTKLQTLMANWQWH